MQKSIIYDHLQHFFEHSIMNETYISPYVLINVLDVDLMTRKWLSRHLWYKLNTLYCGLYMKLMTWGRNFLLLSSWSYELVENIYYSSNMAFQDLFCEYTSVVLQPFLATGIWWKWSAKVSWGLHWRIFCRILQHRGI